MVDAPTPEITDDGIEFAKQIGGCAGAFARKLILAGATAEQARKTVILMFLNIAALDACDLARTQGREPNREKWTETADGAFLRALTANRGAIN